MFHVRNLDIFVFDLIVLRAADSIGRRTIAEHSRNGREETNVDSHARGRSRRTLLLDSVHSFTRSEEKWLMR